jgi:hypothetical protein
MPALELIRSFIDYDIGVPRRVWESTGANTQAQFVADENHHDGAAVHRYSDAVIAQVAALACSLTEAELNQCAADIPGPRR